MRGVSVVASASVCPIKLNPNKSDSAIHEVGSKAYYVHGPIFGRTPWTGDQTTVSRLPTWGTGTIRGSRGILVHNATLQALGKHCKTWREVEVYTGVYFEITSHF
jgi:hypothetical protein